MCGNTLAKERVLSSGSRLSTEDQRHNNSGIQREEKRIKSRHFFFKTADIKRNNFEDFFNNSDDKDVDPQHT